jgi:hypothetical protein
MSIDNLTICTAGLDEATTVDKISPDYISPMRVYALRSHWLECLFVIWMILDSCLSVVETSYILQLFHFSNLNTYLLRFIFP